MNRVVHVTTSPAERCEIAVIGGGIAGLAAAYALRDRDIVVFERDTRLGGRVRSERRGDVWLNLGAHVFGGPGSASGRLLHELGVEAEQVPGRLAAVSMNGKLVATGAVETLPLRLPMPLRSRFAFIRTGLRLRLAVRKYARIAAPRDGEDPAERQLRMLSFMDDRSFTEFAGRQPEDVDELLRCTLTRSSGEPEELAAGYGVGYFHLVWNRAAGLSWNILGGSSTVIDALAAELSGKVKTGARVTAVETVGEGARVTYKRDGQVRMVEARWVVVATPAYVAREIVADLPSDTADALGAIPYGPYVVAAFLTNETEPMPWDDIYALATPKRTFSMLFNTANVLRTRPTRSPAGSLMVYAAAGYARRLENLDDNAVIARFIADLYDVLPGTRGIIEDVVVQRWERGLPFPRVGRSRLQPVLNRDLGHVRLAGDYLGTWYTETAVQTARAAADAIRADLS